MDKEDVVPTYAQTHTHTYAYTHNGNYSAMRKDEILPFATICMELASSMLNERSQMRKTNAAWYHLDVESGEKEANS